MAGLVWIVVIYGPLAIGALCILMAWPHDGQDDSARKTSASGGLVAMLCGLTCLSLMYLRVGRILQTGLWAIIVIALGVYLIIRALRRHDVDAS